MKPVEHGARGFTLTVASETPTTGKIIIEWNKDAGANPDFLLAMVTPAKAAAEVQLRMAKAGNPSITCFSLLVGLICRVCRHELLKSGK